MPQLDLARPIAKWRYLSDTQLDRLNFVLSIPRHPDLSLPPASELLIEARR
jgi:hypothetical protein